LQRGFFLGGSLAPSTFFFESFVTVFPAGFVVVVVASAFFAVPLLTLPSPSSSSDAGSLRFLPADLALEILLVVVLAAGITNSATSGHDAWRCVECHIKPFGWLWAHKGVEGT
jgi:hypothetical protein